MKRESQPPILNPRQGSAEPPRRLIAERTLRSSCGMPAPSSGASGPGLFGLPSCVPPMPARGTPSRCPPPSHSASTPRGVGRVLPVEAAVIDQLDAGRHQRDAERSGIIAKGLGSSARRCAALSPGPMFGHPRWGASSAPGRPRRPFSRRDAIMRAWAWRLGHGAGKRRERVRDER